MPAYSQENYCDLHAIFLVSIIYHFDYITICRLLHLPFQLTSQCRTIPHDAQICEIPKSPQFDSLRPLESPDHWLLSYFLTGMAFSSCELPFRSVIQLPRAISLIFNPDFPTLRYFIVVSSFLGKLIKRLLYIIKMCFHTFLCSLYRTSFHYLIQKYHIC